MAAVILVAVASRAAADNVRVGSFNIANFGDTDEYDRSLLSLVNIIRTMDADVIAVQEVEPNELGSDQMERLVDMLNDAADFYHTEPYDFAVADDYVGDETGAFLWRDPVELESEIWLLDHEADPDDDGKRTFQRVPFVAYFTAGDLDFYLVNCHLYTKLSGANSEGRGEELEALSEWLKQLDEEEIKNAVVVGDFNRFLNGKSAWKKIMPNGYENFYRFPLLEAIERESDFDPKKDEAPEDRFSTTTSKKLSIYDQVLVSAGLFDRIPQEPRFGMDVGIVAFDQDEDFEWFIGNWSDATKLLSDHRPIWIRIGDED